MGADPTIENIHHPLMKRYEPRSFDQVRQPLRDIAPLLGAAA